MDADAAAHHLPYVREVTAFLLTAVVVVPLCQRLKTSPVLGYLAAGVVIGPYGLGIVSDVEGVRQMAELGVVFLLFSIGLELSWQRLKSLRLAVFGLGGAQVAVSAVAIGGIALAWGNDFRAAVLIGLAMALSSTAMVMQLLKERREDAARHGQMAFSVLLFQDLAVVPILVVVQILGSAGDGDLLSALLIALAKALLAVGIIVALGRVFSGRLFRMAALTRSPDTFVALILLVILGTALATAQSGLSMALGAFLAGLLIAETEFRHQVLSDIEPFKGLLLGLFFISVSMSLNPAEVAGNWLWLLAAVAGLVVLKAAIVFGLMRLFGNTNQTSAKTALSLAQAGEFVFIIMGQASFVYGLVPEPTAQFMATVAALSMVVTPLMMAGGGALLKRTAQAAPPPTDLLAGEMDAPGNHVVIAGYGRVGSIAAQLLRAQDVPFVALDMSPARVREAHDSGEPVYYGDARRIEVLEKVGAGNASGLLVTLDDPEAVDLMLKQTRERWPDLPIFVRASDIQHARRLLGLGAREAVPETVESALQLSGRLLMDLGVPATAVQDRIAAIQRDGKGG